jgi:hypothetical protein
LYHYLGNLGFLLAEAFQPLWNPRILSNFEPFAAHRLVGVEFGECAFARGTLELGGTEIRTSEIPYGYSFDSILCVSASWTGTKQYL